MEDFQRRLEFGNQLIQSQAVVKLLDTVIQKSNKKDPSTKIAELELLQTYSHQGSPHVCSLCSEALLSLVRQKCIDFDLGLCGFLNALPSAKHLPGIVNGVIGLLMMQTQLDHSEAGDLQKCPYGIRNHPHPLITVITNRSDSAPLILQSVMKMLGSNERNERPRKDSIVMLAPFLKFILLDPKQDLKYSSLRHMLSFKLPSLIHLNEDLLDFLLRMLPMLQVADTSQICYVTLFIREISRNALQDKGCSMLTKRTIVHQALSLSIKMTQKDISTVDVVDIIQEIAASDSQVFEDDSLLLMLSLLLKRSQQSETLQILKLCGVVLGTIPTCNSLVLGMFILPLLAVISTQYIAAGFWKACQDLASKLVKDIEACLLTKKKSQTDHHRPSNYISAESYNISSYVSLCYTLRGNTEGTREWLQHLLALQSKKWTYSDLTTMFIVSLGIDFRAEVEVLALAVDVLVEICKSCHTQAPDMLSVIMYLLQMPQSGEVKFKLLSCLPHIASHKFCIAPVLRTINLLSRSKPLKPMAVRMMATLWKKHDRCYPHLQKLLQDGADGEDGEDELDISIAAAVKDVCCMRPAQHGADLLPLISKIINDNPDEDHAVPVALVIDALYSLCKHEVIDIETVWSVLSSKLATDTRPLVICHLCKLFSLVPELTCEDQHQEFRSSVYTMLWGYACSRHTSVQGAAYNALMHFSLDEFNVEHLPKQIADIGSFPSSALSGNQQVPATCYINLLRTYTSQHVLTEYGKFLSANIHREISNLPRGRYYSAQKKQSASGSSDKVINTIPDFLHTSYDKNRLPKLQSDLAGGLLYTYNPSVEAGKDGKPKKHHILAHGRNYQQTLDNLLKEVSMDGKDWYKFSSVPEAWANFMERTFTAMLESRRCEVELNYQHGRSDDTEDSMKLKIDMASLWVRDQLTDVLKGAAKGSPTVQGNSLLALAGLARTVYTYNQHNGTEMTTGQHISMAAWIVLLTDTIMTVLDGTYTPKGPVLPWGQQGIDIGVSVLAQASALLAVPLLVPALLVCHSDRIFHVLKTMCNNLQRHGDASDDRLTFYNGIGLGMLLQTLYEEHFEDITGTQGMVALSKSLDALELCCFNRELKINRSGCWLGLGLALSGMSRDTNIESRCHVSVVFDKILQCLETSSQSTDLYFQEMLVCIAMVASSSYGVDIINTTATGACLNKLVQHEQMEQSMGSCFAVGLLCHCLKVSGHPTIEKTHSSLYTKWFAQLIQEDLLPSRKRSLMLGLFALMGSEMTYFKMFNVVDTGLEPKLVEIIKTAQRILSEGNDLDLQGMAACMLGHMYLSSLTSDETHSHAPEDYSYLPETSFLRSAIGITSECVKLGSELCNKDLLLVVLRSITDIGDSQLPSLNWTKHLTPLMKMGFGSEVRKCCLQIAANQSCHSPNAALVIIAWLQSPLYDTMELPCKIQLWECLPKFIKVIPVQHLQSLLHKVPDSNADSAERELLMALYRGVRGALQVTTPTEGMMAVLYNFLALKYDKMFDNTKINLKNDAILEVFSECMCELPDDVIDKMTESDFCSIQTRENHYKACYLRSHLVAKGKQPIFMLNSCIDASLNNLNCNRSAILGLLNKAFSACTPIIKATEHLHWFLEFIGHVRNLADGKVPFSFENNTDNQKKAISYAISIISSLVHVWSGSQSFEILWPENLLHEEQLLGQLQYILPNGVVALMTMEPWKQLKAKVIDWLITMKNSQLVDGRTTCTIIATLSALRGEEEFLNTKVWSGAYS